MAVIVRIPTVLRKLTKSQAEVEASGSDVLALIDDLEAKYPGLKERICDDKGKIRRFVNLFINDEDIRFRGNETAKLKDGDVVSIVPAVAGGLEKAVGSTAVSSNGKLANTWANIKKN